MDIIGPNWKIKNINAVIFDKDGTIIDSNKYWGEIIMRRSRALIRLLNLDSVCYKNICFAMGYSVEKKKLLPNGPIALVGRDEVINILVKFFKELGVEVSFKVIENIFYRIHNEFLKDIHKYIKILPGAKSILKRMKARKIKIVLLTSDSENNAIEIMSYLKLFDCFDIIAGKELTKYAKVSGVPAKLLCKQLNVDPQEVVCIGDAPMDITMGSMANLKNCIAIASGQTPFKQLRKETRYVIKNFNELTMN